MASLHLLEVACSGAVSSNKADVQMGQEGGRCKGWKLAGLEEAAPGRGRVSRKRPCERTRQRDPASEASSPGGASAGQQSQVRAGAVPHGGEAQLAL
nr:uncharacterized protein LOC105102807 [Camelus dromedarius]